MKEEKKKIINEENRENFSEKKIRVLYADTDRMGVVYHGTYFRWFEAGRADYMRKREATYADIEKKGLFLPVVETHVEYHKPALYDDILTVKTSVEKIGRVQVKFIYQISKEDRVIVTGFTRHATVNEAGRPTKLPEYVKEALVKRETIETGKREI